MKELRGKPFIGYHRKRRRLGRGGCQLVVDFQSQRMTSEPRSDANSYNKPTFSCTPMVFLFVWPKQGKIRIKGDLIELELGGIHVPTYDA